jgi:two-component system sensor histidine kinase/response regulator
MSNDDDSSSFGRDARGLSDGAHSLLRTGTRKPRVLVAEDNPVNQEVAIGLLEKIGLEVDIAATGLEALEMASAKVYDLILMDVQMPGMDGLEAARLMRLRPETMTVPILAMTGAMGPDNKAACLAAGMNDCLSKPLAPATLKRLLGAWLPADERFARPSTHSPAPTETPAQATSGLPAIIGIDTAQGVAFFGGSVAAYFTGLAMFVDLKQPAIDAALAYLADPTPGTGHALHRETHSLAGACAAIGATGLATQASMISVLLTRPDATVAPEVSSMLEELKEVVANIESALRHRA